MAINCVPREQIEKLREGVKNGDINIADLYELTSKERKIIFNRYTTPEIADFVNLSFEKAMLSSRKQAMANWVQKTFTQQETIKKDLLDKIERIKELQNENYQIAQIEDFVMNSLGVKVSDAEVAELIEFSSRLKELRKNLDPWGNPNQEYFTKRRELINYLNSINPNSNINILLGTVSRGAMLFSVKSPFLNIESNTLFGALGALERRLLSWKFKGLNNAEVYKFIKHNTLQYTKTQTDLIILDSLNTDYVVLGEKIVHSQGTGPIRKLGRLTESYAFKYPQGAPDIFAESFHFADFLNIETTKIAYQEGLRGNEAKQRALDLMKDAININPQDPIAIDLRQKARADALFYTYKNTGLFSKGGFILRDFVNTMGNAMGMGRIGEAVMPFIKTPANVVQAGVDFSGGYGIKGIMEIYKAYKKGNIEGVDSVHLKNGLKYLIRQGLGMVAVGILSTIIKDTNYMPDYLVASDEEKNFARQYKIPFNSVKISGHWVSFDYFGPLGAPFKSFIHARKYGDSAGGKLFQYGFAVVRQIMTFPGIKEFTGLLGGTWKKMKETEEQTAGGILEGIYNTTIDFVSARFIPAIFSDLARGIDQYERQATGAERALMKIPLLRQLLPKRINIFGEKIKTEPFLVNIATGARVRTVWEGEVYNELERLLEQGELPSIKDLEYSSNRVKLMKEKIGEEEFKELIIYFGKNFKEKIEQLIKRPSYKRLDNEEKKKEWNSIKDDILERTLQKFHYTRIKRKEERETKNKK